MTEQWWIQKRSPGGPGPPPSFFFIDQSEAQRAEKNSLETIFPPHPLSYGLDPVLPKTYQRFPFEGGDLRYPV